MSKAKNKAFTLVELIVVIVILAILATIAFLSFSSQSASARDSTRLTDLSNIAKSLGIFNATAGNYPMPDKAINILNGSLVIGYQGTAGSGVKKIINANSNNGGFTDPTEKTDYTYTVNAGKSKFQLVAFLENSRSTSMNFNLPIDALNATAYANRYPFSKGDNLGTLITSTGSSSGMTYTPIQDVSVGAFGTTASGIDLSNGSLVTLGISAIVDGNTIAISSTGSLYSAIDNFTRARAATDDTTSLLLHFDGNSGSSMIYDSSKYSKQITINGSVNMTNNMTLPGFGQSAYFNGSGSFLTLPFDSDFDVGSGSFTLDYWVYFEGAASINDFIYSNDAGTVTSLYCYNYTPSNSINFYINASTYIGTTTGNWIANPDKWHHIAFVRDNSNWNIYVDGIYKNGGTNTGAINAAGMTKILIAGKRGFKGYMDELRFTKGIARWTGNFTPPTSPY